MNTEKKYDFDFFKFEKPEHREVKVEVPKEWKIKSLFSIDKEKAKDNFDHLQMLIISILVFSLGFYSMAYLIHISGSDILQKDSLLYALYLNPHLSFKSFLYGSLLISSSFGILWVAAVSSVRFRFLKMFMVLYVAAGFMYIQFDREIKQSFFIGIKVIQIYQMNR